MLKPWLLKSEIYLSIDLFGIMNAPIVSGVVPLVVDEPEALSITLIFPLMTNPLLSESALGSEYAKFPVLLNFIGLVFWVYVYVPLSKENGAAPDVEPFSFIFKL